MCSSLICQKESPEPLKLRCPQRALFEEFSYSWLSLSRPASAKFKKVADNSNSLRFYDLFHQNKRLNRRAPPWLAILKFINLCQKYRLNKFFQTILWIFFTVVPMLVVVIGSWKGEKQQKWYIMTDSRVQFLVRERNLLLPEYFCTDCGTK